MAKHDAPRQGGALARQATDGWLGKAIKAALREISRTGAHFLLLRSDLGHIAQQSAIWLAVPARSLRFLAKRANAGRLPTIAALNREFLDENSALDLANPPVLQDFPALSTTVTL